MIERHGHDAFEVNGVAEASHQHYDVNREVEQLRSELAGLRDDLSDAEGRISDLETKLDVPGERP
jgi:chromosome segregation ATPase